MVLKIMNDKIVRVKWQYSNALVYKRISLQKT